MKWLNLKKQTLKKGNIMTQILPKYMKCPICGGIVEGYDCISLFVWSQDLDLRQKTGWDQFYEFCYNCHYVARDHMPKRISSKIRELVLSNDYQKIFKTHKPLDEQNYLALAFFDTKMNKPAKVIGSNYLNIAWCYDDWATATLDEEDEEEDLIPPEKAIKKAIEYRKIAIKYYEKASDLNSKLILIDLLRRTSQFEKAQKIIKQTKFPKKYDIIINTQKELLDKKDIEAHHI